MDKSYVRKQLMTDQTLEAIKTINELSEVRPTIDLETFVRVYLPALGQKHDKPLSLGPWLDLVKSPYVSIDVVSGGDVVYTVPPLLNRTQTRVTRNRPESLSSLVETVQRKSDISPNMGIAYLRSGLQQRITQKIVSSTQVSVWNKILTDNGYEPLVTGYVEQENQSDQPKVENNLTFDDYEDV